MVLASGGQDGAICLWDVLTGSRVSHVYGHRGDVTSLVCTTLCVISSGLDDLICIWDRSTGIKLYSIQQVPDPSLIREIGPSYFSKAVNFSLTLVTYSQIHHIIVISIILALAVYSLNKPASHLSVSLYPRRWAVDPAWG